MRVLVTGASGYIGSLLVPRLRLDGHLVRALGRDPARVDAALALTDATPHGERVEVLRGDALAGDGLEAALAGVEVAYYLIHSIERPRSARLAGSPFAERDRLAAHNFATAARGAGVRRIVYLGGLLPRAGARTLRAPHDVHARDLASAHLASRAQVEQLLLDAVPDSLALRASIVIGARSRSFRLLVRLVERMPVLTLPAWHTLRTQPIDERDVIEMLAAAAGARAPRRTLDAGGPRPLSYGEMLQTIAELMLVGRPAVPLPVNFTNLTARLAAALAGEDPELVLALMQGLQSDLLPADDRAAELLGVRLHSFESSVEHALARWVQSEPLAAR
ncbi:MAG TPA: NAD(P)H-binding protein [Solirubrobacteraceae bacterium]|jgi:uncharacterized protein YbjT (DUF2867 family)|nr:NAD(P)H-binding protein [Solirubrobacteraceae bacterium]